MRLVIRIYCKYYLLLSKLKVLLLRKGSYLVDKIRDSAAQKGTGKWAVIEAINAGVPASVITESVSARLVSALKEDRVAASTKLVGPHFDQYQGDIDTMLDDIKKVILLTTCKVKSIVLKYTPINI